MLIRDGFIRSLLSVFKCQKMIILLIFSLLSRVAFCAFACLKKSIERTVRCYATTNQVLQADILNEGTWKTDLSLTLLKEI